MCQAANRIKKKLLNLTIQKMRRQPPFFKLEAKKGQKTLQFSYSTMLLEPQRRIVKQRGKEGKSFRLLNGDGGSIDSVDVYEISENRIVEQSVSQPLRSVIRVYGMKADVKLRLFPSFC
jgi:hypothetical protein